METYKETVLRFCVVRIAKLPEEHAAEYRLKDIHYDIDADGDPVTASLIWSFPERHLAEAKCAELEREEEDFRAAGEGRRKVWSYEVRDLGTDFEIIERPVWV